MKRSGPSDKVGDVGIGGTHHSLEPKLYSLSASKGQTSTNQSLGRQAYSLEEIERLMWAAKIGQHHGIDLATHRLLGKAGCEDFPLLSWRYVYEELRWYEEGNRGELP